MSEASKRTGLLATAVLALLAVGCIEMRREVPAEVTPGTVPVEIQDARWDGFPVSYCLVPDPGPFDPARLAEMAGVAFDAWGVDATFAGECEGPVERGNGQNEVAWGMPANTQAPTGEGGVFQAGFTQQLFQTCPGGCEGGAQSRIVEADILITPSLPEHFSTEECVFSTLLHEAGHFLGMPHLESPAVMAPATDECPQSLTDADRAAFSSLYSQQQSRG